MCAEILVWKPEEKYNLEIVGVEGRKILKVSLRK